MSAIITENTQVSYRARWKIPLGHSSDGDAEQIVGREERRRLVHRLLSGGSGYQRSGPHDRRVSRESC